MACEQEQKKLDGLLQRKRFGFIKDDEKIDMQISAARERLKLCKSLSDATSGKSKKDPAKLIRDSYKKESKKTDAAKPRHKEGGEKRTYPKQGKKYKHGGRPQHN